MNTLNLLEDEDASLLEGSGFGLVEAPEKG